MIDRGHDSDIDVDVFDDAWFDALEKSLGTLRWKHSSSAPVLLGVTILPDDGTEATPLRYLVTFSTDGVTLERPGARADAAVVAAEFTQTRATAAAIINGVTSAQMSFMSGDMRLVGDVSTLLAHRLGAVSALDTRG